jgi:hypothetical protein
MRTSLSILTVSIGLLTTCSTPLLARVLREKEDQTERRLVHYHVEALKQGYKVTEDFMTGSTRVVTVIPGLISQDQTIHRDNSTSTSLIGALHLPITPLSKEALEQQDEYQGRKYYRKGFKKWLEQAREMKRTSKRPSKKLLLMPSYDGLDSDNSNLSIDWGL